MKNKSVIPVLILAVGLSVALLLAGLQLTSQRLHAAPTAATWYVDAATGSDSNDCLSPGSACLTVLAAANKAADGDSIQIAAGTYQENLDLSKTLTMTGAGPDATFLDGGGSHRVLQTAGIAGLRLENLTIQNGFVTGSGERGGGIYNLGTLHLVQVTVQNNEAENDGGGGIFNSGTLILENSQVISNSTNGAGGGVYGWNTSHTTLNNSLIEGNEASLGGGVFTSDVLVLADSTFSGNSAANGGGGVYLSGGEADLNSSTLTNNHSDSIGGAIYNSSGGITLTNVTVSANSADNYTGLANVGGSAAATVLNSTFAHNIATGTGLHYGGIASISSSTVTLSHTLFRNNGDRNCLASGAWTSSGYNLADDFYCDLHGTGDLEGEDALLGDLADNGGTTETHALLAGSPAIDAGNNATCAATDQRGVARPFDGDSSGTAVCDIGAFEAQLQLTISDASVLEGDAGTTEMVFTVTLAPMGNVPVSVNYTTVDGTAVSPTDYLADAGNLTFDPGETSQPITITVNGDTDDGADKTFTVQLSGASGADLIDSSGVGTIIDDDGLPSLAINDVTLTEGSGGAQVASFTVTLSPTDTQPVTVNYATVGGTAVAGEDFTAASDMLTFDPGESSQTIDVTIIGDTIDEADSETFSVVLSGPTNANISDGSGAGTINDDDTAQVSLAVGPTVPEGNSGSGTAVFTVILTNETAFPVTVEYQTSNACCGPQFATAGEDYEASSGTLTFNAGETSQTVAVTVYGDVTPEEDETFSLNINNPDPITVYASAASATIQNDDFAVFLPAILKP